MVGVLIQIDAWDPVAGTLVTLRATNHDRADVCHLDGKTWWPAIAQAPTLRLDLFDGAFAGGITAPSSSMTIAVEPWPDLPRWSLADARFRLWTGEPGSDFGAWTPRFDGRVTEQPAVANGIATINFAVDDRWLDTPLLQLYAGTGGIEGPAELKGTPKPLALGAPRYAPGVLIDPINTVLQLSGYGRIEAVEAALEKLARFGASAGDHADFAALVAAQVPAGRWATCLAQGLVRHGAPLSGQPSYQVRGDRAGPDGWVRLPGGLIARIAALAGGGDRVSAASLAALDAARPWPLSLYMAEQTTARELIQRIAASINAVAGISWLGKLFVAPVGIGAPALTLRSDGSTLPQIGDVSQLAAGQPFWRIGLQAERTWQVHGFVDIAFTAELVELGDYAASTTYREGNIVQHQGVTWLYINPVASAGNPPPPRSTMQDAFWRALSPPLDAGETAEWDKVCDQTGTKPDDNATNSADPASPFGPGGTVGEAVLRIAQVPALTAATELLDKATIDLAAAGRQADRDRARIAQAQLGAVVEGDRLRAVLRDAGVVVDPATGTVRLFAVDQLADRTAAVEVVLDGVKGQLSLVATYDQVEELIAQAAIDPSQIAELGAIIARLNSAEVSLNAINAAIQLKADAVTVTQLGGSVSEVSQLLDALNGVVATKASSTTVAGLAERIGVAETQLSAIPDLSSFTVTLRQVQRAADSGAAAGLGAAVAADAEASRRVVAAAEARQELYARLVDGELAEAAARILLAAQLGAANARAAQEVLTRAAADEALAQSLSALSATLGQLGATVLAQGQAIVDGDQASANQLAQVRAELLGDVADLAAAAQTSINAAIAAEVTRTDQAIATSASASASLIQQVSALIGNLGGVTVQQRFAADADRLGKVEGTATIAIDTEGNLVGTRLVGSASGPGELGLINANLRMGSGIIVSRAGLYEVRRGAGFGSAGNLIEWYGLWSVPLGGETLANSRWAMAADGKVYAGGADLEAGASSPDRVRELSLSGSTGPSGSGTSVIASVAANVPAGGRFRISGRLNTAAIEGGSGEISGLWTIRFYVTFGSSAYLLAEAQCSVDRSGFSIVDGVAALTGRLFANPSSGPCTLSATAQRSGSPNNGVSSTWTGSAIVEWVNA